MPSHNGAKANLAVAPWIAESLRTLKPPERITVSQWADRYRQLSGKSSNASGRWRTSRTPYLRDVMDSFNDPEVEEIVFVKATQVGGTECFINIIGYIADEDASPTLVVYPQEDLAMSVSKNRLQPMIEQCWRLRDKYLPQDSKLLELQFMGMYLGLTGANSPTQLSSKPIRFLLLDEVDKYPSRAGREADPISLARERTKTFSYNRKILVISTPTTKDGAVMKAYEGCETQYHFYVPCPHCGEFQRLRFRGVKYDSETEGLLDSERADTAYYECAHCAEKIVDAHKAKMLAAGEWRAEKSGSRRKVGFHINAIYSPWVTFRDVVEEWLKSKDDHESLQNFINSWLAEPWEQVSSTVDYDKVLSLQSRYTQGVVPDGTRLITGGSDKQKNGYYYTIRAWGDKKRSWNIDHGFVDTKEEVREIMDSVYHDERSGRYVVDLCLLDSGDDTDEVYEFCYTTGGLIVPLKGSSTRIPQNYRRSTVTKADSLAYGMELVLCDGHYYKDFIARRINHPSESSGWFVFEGCDLEYAKQIASEHKVLERRGGREQHVWKPKTSHADNHYLDCEVYAACAADIMGGFDLLVEQPDDPRHEKRAEPEQATSPGWLKGGNDWL